LKARKRLWFLDCEEACDGNDGFLRCEDLVADPQMERDQRDAKRKSQALIETSYDMHTTHIPRTKLQLVLHQELFPS